MGMNETPAGERTQIAFFGCRNAGKSSLINAVTGQAVSVVSPVRGTTTDPVSRAMELLPLGPVIIIDTPGFDDEGELGELRTARTREVLRRTDLAVLVTDAEAGLREADRELLRLLKERGIPCLIALNRWDLLKDRREEERTGILRKAVQQAAGAGETPEALPVSALSGEGIRELKEKLARMKPEKAAGKRLAADLVKAGDCAVLVCPIDEAAPKGRLILPQQQVIRDLLEAGAAALVAREKELARTLDALKQPPAVVITDSQVFREVFALVPEEVPLTSFSILMARYKGFLERGTEGAAALDRLKDGSVVLMAEGCAHHRQCNDIGTVKIPRWLKAHTGRDLKIETSTGTDFPQDLRKYGAVIQCGGCMLPEREVQARMKAAEEQGVPFTNYGLAIAYMTGILERSLRLFPEAHALLKGGAP